MPKTSKSAQLSATVRATGGRATPPHKRPTNRPPKSSGAIALDLLRRDVSHSGYVMTALTVIALTVSLLGSCSHSQTEPVYAPVPEIGKTLDENRIDSLGKPAKPLPLWV